MSERPANIRIIASSVLDVATLENNDTDTLYPITNLQIAQTALKHRTNTTAVQQIISDLIDYEAVSGWSLNGHNLGYGSTVQLSLYTTVNRDVNISAITHAAGIATITLSGLHGIFADGANHAMRFAGIGGSVELNDKIFDCTVISTNVVTVAIASITAYTSGGTATSLHEVFNELQDGVPTQYGWGEQPWGLGGWGGYDTSKATPDYVNFWFNSVVANYMRVIITDTANSDGYIEAGRIILGLSMNPKYNFLWGAGIGFKSQTKVTRTRSGSLFSDNRPSFRFADFKLSYLSEAEAMQLLDMMDNPGLRSDALISMYPDHKGVLGQRTTILGRFVKHSPVTRSMTGYNISVNFEEAL